MSKSLYRRKIKIKGKISGQKSEVCVYLFPGQLMHSNKINQNVYLNEITVLDNIGEVKYNKDNYFDVTPITMVLFIYKMYTIL